MVVGTGYTLALKVDGSLWAWGNNASGQLGDGTTTFRPTPVRIGLETNWIAVAVDKGCYSSFSVALRADGTLWIWGSNQGGPLGNPSYFVPTRVGTDSDWGVPLFAARPRLEVVAGIDASKFRFRLHGP